jgi:hypothetical protein
VKTFFGGILLAIGILIAGASGLCTVVFLTMTVGHGAGGAEGFSLMLVVGGIPFTIGMGLFFAGRALIREDQEDREDRED